MDSDSDDDAAKGRQDTERRAPKAYDEEQENLRKAFLSAADEVCVRGGM